MEKYYIEFRRRYKEKWDNLCVKYNNYQSAKNAVMDMIQDDFHAKDYGYEYRIMKDNKQIDNIYYLTK